MLEQGNEKGSQAIGWTTAVKKGIMAEGSWWNTSILSGDEDVGGPVEGVNLKRARCLIRGKGARCQQNC